MAWWRWEKIEEVAEKEIPKYAVMGVATATCWAGFGILAPSAHKGWISVSTVVAILLGFFMANHWRKLIARNVALAFALVLSAIGLAFAVPPGVALVWSGAANSEQVVAPISDPGDAANAAETAKEQAQTTGNGAAGNMFFTGEDPSPGFSIQLALVETANVFNFPGVRFNEPATINLISKDGKASLFNASGSVEHISKGEQRPLPMRQDRIRKLDSGLKVLPDTGYGISTSTIVAGVGYGSKPSEQTSARIPVFMGFEGNDWVDKFIATTKSTKSGDVDYRRDEIVLEGEKHAAVLQFSSWLTVSRAFSLGFDVKMGPNPGDVKSPNRKLSEFEIRLPSGGAVVLTDESLRSLGSQNEDASIVRLGLGANFRQLSRLVVSSDGSSGRRLDLAFGGKKVVVALPWHEADGWTDQVSLRMSGSKVEISALGSGTFLNSQAVRSEVLALSSRPF